ncbi:Major structural subunit of bundle-forming pilus [Sodalis praecaptivus]
MSSSKKAINQYPKWQRGLSLIEAAMVLALSAVVVAGVMAYYQSASTNEKTERTISETMSILSAVNSTYSSAPNFAGINSEIIAKTGALPSSYISRNSSGKISGITTPNGARIDIAPGKLSDSSSNEYFTISFGVPKSMCPTMVRLDLGSSLAEMGIGTTNNPITTFPVSVADSQAKCDAAPADKNTKDQITLYYSFH